MRSERISYCSHAGHTKVPPPRMIRKPSISPFSERTFLPSSFRRPKDDQRLVGPGLLVAHPNHQVREKEKDRNDDQQTDEKRGTHDFTSGVENMRSVSMTSPT